MVTVSRKRNEINKVLAHQLAQDLLSQSELARLLSANDSEEVCRRSLRFQMRQI